MSLSEKELRNAAPPDTLPFEVVRKYGEPWLYRTIGDVRRALLGDLDEIGATFRGGVDLSGLRQQIAGLGEEDLPFTVEQVVDELTGVKYEVTVVDRRKQ